MHASAPRKEVGQDIRILDKEIWKDFIMELDVYDISPRIYQYTYTRVCKYGYMPSVPHNDPGY